MTDAMSPHSAFMGKKRSSVDIIEEEMVPGFNFGSFSQPKRGRMFENTNPNPQAVVNCNDNFKTQRIEYGNQQVNQLSFDNQFRQAQSELANKNMQIEQLQNYHDSVINALKKQHQASDEKKLQEFNQMKALNSALIQSLDNTKREGQVALEENRVLKKAVTIQDTRNRELQSQNQQLQNVLQLAANHIAKLEETNRQLQSMQPQKPIRDFSNDRNNFPPPDSYGF